MDRFSADARHRRFDRQERIPGWRQDLLARTCLGVVSDGTWDASFLVLGAAALGIPRAVVISPRMEPVALDLAREIHPESEIAHVAGHLTHPALASLLDRCSVLVDFSRSGLTNKILFNFAWKRRRPLIRVHREESGNRRKGGLGVYVRGREAGWIREMIGKRSFALKAEKDPVWEMVLAGLVLEEVKRLRFGGAPSGAPIRWDRPGFSGAFGKISVGIVGAGALGNFVSLCLALAGCGGLTVWDPDTVDLTNLNRQVLFGDAIGRNKAEALGEKLNRLTGVQVTAVPEAFSEDTSIESCHVIMDCTDNFEARVLLSRKAKVERKMLVSGGTGPDRGQVLCYHPEHSSATPAEVLGLEEIVRRRTYRRSPAGDPSCTAQPDPSVVMSNQVVGGLMVEVLGGMLAGDLPCSVFYESRKEGIFLEFSDLSIK